MTGYCFAASSISKKKAGGKERVIGHDLRGVVSLIERPGHVFLVCAVWLLSLLTLIWHHGTHNSADWAIDYAGEFAFGVRQQLQERIAVLVQS